MTGVHDNPTAPALVVVEMTVAQCRAQSWQPVTVGALRYEWADARMAEAKQRVLRLLRGRRGMCDNPANVRVFGIRDAERRCRALAQFFVPVLRGLYRRGVVLGAFREDALVGVCGIARPGRCQPPLGEKLRVVPAVPVGNQGARRRVD